MRRACRTPRPRRGAAAPPRPARPPLAALPHPTPPLTPNRLWLGAGRGGAGGGSFSKPCRTEAQAEKALSRAEAQVSEGTFTPAACRRVTYDELAKMVEEDYTLRDQRSARRLKTARQHLDPVFGGRRAVS